MSTRRTYELLNVALMGAKPHRGMFGSSLPDDFGVKITAAMIQWQADCHIVALALKTQNRNFDVDRFLKDCGVQS